MQINKSKKQARRQSSSTLFDSDFAAGFEDSKFDKFKPALKALVVVVLLVGVVWGAVAYFGSTDTKNNADKDYTANTAQQADDSDSKLSQCIADAAAKNPTPDTSDTNFYPKLISGYDAQLACYDKYPDANGAVSRSSIEYARDNALDSSGDYKNTYTSSTSGSSSSSKNSVTGCDYSLSESEYLACSDKYYAAHSSPSSSSSSSIGNTSTPPETPSTPSTPPSNTSGGSSSGSSGGSSQDPATAGYTKCVNDAMKLSGQYRSRAIEQCNQAYGL